MLLVILWLLTIAWAIPDPKPDPNAGLVGDIGSLPQHRHKHVMVLTHGRHLAAMIAP